MKLNDISSALDGDQLLKDLEDLAQISAPSDEGVNRVAFSPADREGREWVSSRMEELDMVVWVDSAGNTVGVYGGQESDLNPLALGSHTDTVPNGGRYDGALGVLAGLACVRTLRESGVQLRHPVELINFSAEEATVAGATFGSRAMAGMLGPGVVDQKAWDGRLVAEHLSDAGLDPKTVTYAARSRGDLVGYLELHVEQGSVLESAGVPIGTVEGIVGIRRYEVVFDGVANHAGTTPMEDRRDALVSAAPFVRSVRDVAMSRGVVGTVGTLQVHPGAANVIPGRVDLSVEIRALQETDLDGVEEELRNLAEHSGAHFERVSHKAPVMSDAGLLTTLEVACEEVSLPYLRMVSGAGHDAMCMAAITRQAMLFVPSRGGVSHSPDEFTDPGSCVAGARALLAALTKLDSELDAEAVG